MKLINKIKSLVSRPSVDDLTQECNSIVDVFTQTVNKLVKVNETISSEVAHRTTIIEDLQQENTTLEEMKIRNSKVITKITSIMND